MVFSLRFDQIVWVELWLAVDKQCANERTRAKEKQISIVVHAKFEYMQIVLKFLLGLAAVDGFQDLYRNIDDFCER